MTADRPRPRATERRARPTRWLSRYTFVGRRRELRRVADRVPGGYVDRPRAADVLLVIAVVVLSFADAVLTLDHIGRGGMEWNPVMRRLLDHGVAAFVVGKMGVTTVGMVFLLVHMHFRRTRTFARFVLAAYVALTIYHATLLDIGADPEVGTLARLSSTLGDVGRALFG